MRSLVLAIILALAAFAADDDKKSDKSEPPIPSSIGVKLGLEKADVPIPVRFSFSITLPTYCIFSGLNSTKDPVAFDPKLCGKPSAIAEQVSANADDLLEAFSKDTQYVVQKGDDDHLFFFCAATHCDPLKDKARIRRALLPLAAPSLLRFEDVTPGPGVNPSDLADAVALFSNGAVTGRALPSGKVRLETSKKLDPLTIQDLLAQTIQTNKRDLTSLQPLLSDFSAKRIALPSFCIATKLTGPAPTVSDDNTCPPHFRLAQAANAADIAAALTHEKIKVTADSPSSLIVSCGAETCDGDAVGVMESSAKNMARPKPAYVEDFPVLPHTAYNATASIAKWTNGTILADIVSDNLIRLKADSPINPGDLTVIHDRLLDAGFGNPAASPTDRLFYSDAAAIVSRLENLPTPDTKAGASTFGTGMTAVGDTVVFSGDAPVTDNQRIRLLTLLDLPRPEVIMNLWSLQESNPDGKELAAQSRLIRSTIAIHNEALQNAIEYGWSYLSQQMKNEEFFDKDFKNYLTQRFVSDTRPCDAKDPTCTLTDEHRADWKICNFDKYCLGYGQIFEPLKPTLTNILLGIMASKDPLKTVFTTLGCMEGKFEVYEDDCFSDRAAIRMLPLFTAQQTKNAPSSDPKTCLAAQRQNYLDRYCKSKNQPSCEDLDRAGLYAQRQCGVPVALPLACFTVQAAKSFVPLHGFSTYSTRYLNNLAEANIAKLVSENQAMQARSASYSASPIGLLRAATANFLFNYKMAQQFPKEFSPYLLTQSAQELNAEFNPLIVAFNEDVSAFSTDLMKLMEDEFTGHHYLPWDSRNKSFITDGSITVRGISGVESLVDTATMSSFSAPQFQTIPGILNNLAGLTADTTPPAGSTTTTDTATTNGDTTTETSTTEPAVSATPPPLSSNLKTLLPGALRKASVPVALAAAISPTAAQAQIGRQLNLHVTPHTLPGASSAELEVNLTAQEDSPPTLYKDNGASQNDSISRVARHNVVTRVRVESVKLFEVSSFSALVQRPRTNFPLVPPFVQIPFVSDIVSLPLPGAKVYYRSSAIISAVIVPTAADLAFGLQFHADRAVVKKSDQSVQYMRIVSQDQLPPVQRRLYPFNEWMVNCFARQKSNCDERTFTATPPEK